MDRKIALKGKEKKLAEAFITKVSGYNAILEQLSQLYGKNQKHFWQAMEKAYPEIKGGHWHYCEGELVETLSWENKGDKQTKGGV